MAVTQDKPAPYAPPTGIVEIIKRFRSRGLPIPLNAEALGRVGVPDSLIPRTLQALQTLDLINEDGSVTPTFEAIRLVPEAEYKKRLEDWLKATYADVFAIVDPATDDETRVRDAFRGYQPIGQQGRMVTLFLGLCTEAGLIAGKNPQPRPRDVGVVRQPLKPRFKRPIVTNMNTVARDTAGLPLALAGLLHSLPPQGAGWTSADRKKFMDTFGAVLDFCFPVVERGAEADEEEEAR